VDFLGVPAGSIVSPEHRKPNKEITFTLRRSVSNNT
jgi:hypothetical protein